jgi:hypothetical protein
MALIAKDNDGEFEPTPRGNQQAVCNFVYDIGTHIQNFNNSQKERKMIIIGWELAETMTIGNCAGKPFTVLKSCLGLTLKILLGQIACSI